MSVDTADVATVYAEPLVQAEALAQRAAADLVHKEMALMQAMEAGLKRTDFLRFSLSRRQAKLLALRIRQLARYTAFFGIGDQLVGGSPDAPHHRCVEIAGDDDIVPIG